MNQSTSALSALVDIFVDPKKAIEGLDANPSWFWMPLILLIVVPTSAVIYYFYTIDILWVYDQGIIQTAALGIEIPEEAVEQGRKEATASGMAIQNSIGTIIAPFVIYSIVALYYNIVNKFTMNDTRGFKNWFALAVYAHAPVILATIVAILYYGVIGDDQMGLEEMQFFSANSLLTHLAANEAGSSLFGSITPFTFWTIGLFTVGLMTWTKRTLAKSLMITSAPYVAIYGVWAYIAFG